MAGGVETGAGDAGGLDGEADTSTGSALVFASPSSGRFFHRPSPDAPPFVEEGVTLEPGRAIGLIEIMKTFHQVHYRPDGTLPARATLVRFVAADGDDVREGEGLIEVAGRRDRGSA